MRTVRTVLAGGLALLAVAGLLATARPAGAAPLTGATALASRSATSCVVTDVQQVRCWGGNDHGQVGDGTTTERPRARLVRKVAGAGALLQVAQVSVGGEHSCARLTNGQAVCWGRNVDGRLGDGTTSDRTRPVVVLNGFGSAPLTGVAAAQRGGEPHLRAPDQRARRVLGRPTVTVRPGAAAGPRTPCRGSCCRAAGIGALERRRPGVGWPRLHLRPAQGQRPGPLLG